MLIKWSSVCIPNVANHTEDRHCRPQGVRGSFSDKLTICDYILEYGKELGYNS
jgi:hypothetical protein